MKIEDIQQELERENIAYVGFCHDCGAAVTVKASLNEEGEINISGGAIYKIKQGIEDELFFKCDTCFEKDKTLRNFQHCEVYSRVVGYLRPVQQWNKGKKEEFELRKEFKNTM